THRVRSAGEPFDISPSLGYRVRHTARHPSPRPAMLTRRRFLAASSALATPYVYSRAADEPKDKVRLAVIGVANRGRENLNGVALGPINRVHVWLGSPPPRGKVVTPTVKPKFDLDVWLGPATAEYFTADHPGSPFNNHPWPHFQWRYWWAFGGGQLADFGCH